MKLEQFSGVNAGYVLELYEDTGRTPSRSIRRRARHSSRGRPPTPSRRRRPCPPRRRCPSCSVIVGAANLAESIRRYGHLAATLDPLGSAPIGDPSLLAAGARHHRRRSGALPASLVGGPSADGLVATPTRRSRSCAASTARPPASTSRTCSCPRSASGCATPPSRAASCRRWIAASAEALLDRHHAGRGVRALPAPHVPRQDAVLGRRARHARARCSTRSSAAPPAPARGTRARHGAPRPPQRAGAHAAEAVRADPRRVQGSDRGAGAADRSRLDGRREVPRGARTAAPRGQMFVTMAPNPSHLEAVNPVVVGMARAAGTLADRAGRAASSTAAMHAADADSRRRGVSRPGHRGRDAEPVAARRLRHRRHDPHHRQQPARVHGHARRVLQHQLRQRPGARLQDPDRARQRRRSGRVPRGRAPGLGVSRAVPPRLPDRSGRLPPLRPQRGRRAGVHAAADVQEDRRAPDRARAVRRARWSSRARCRRTTPDALVEEALHGAREGVRVAQARRGLRGADPRRRPRRAWPARRRPGCRSSGSRDQRRAARDARGLHVPQEAGARPRAAKRAMLAKPDERTVDWATRRGAGVGDDPRRRHSDPPDRRGRRARHLQPSPRRASRRR